MILRPPSISTESFTFSDRRFVAEASDLGPDFRLGRVFDDACDEGFTLVSHRTGKDVVFAHHEDKVDLDGDLAVSIFKGVTPGFTDLEVHILND